jgi:hypothetical protein
MGSIAPFLPMIALTGLLTAIRVSAVILGVSPSEGILTESSVGLFLILWMMMDARRRRCVPCHEFGFLAGVYMPISLLWYLCWSRGWKGLLLLAAFLGMVLLPGITAGFVYVYLYGWPQ